MYPLASYTILKVLDHQRIGRVEDVWQAQQHYPVARSFARTLGHALTVLGNRLEHFGR
jgi:hypothetical protein